MALSLPDDVLRRWLAARDSDDEAYDERMQIEAAGEPISEAEAKLPAAEGQ